jgi:hypothetical protein
MIRRALNVHIVADLHSGAGARPFLASCWSGGMSALMVGIGGRRALGFRLADLCTAERVTRAPNHGNRRSCPGKAQPAR